MHGMRKGEFRTQIMFHLGYAQLLWMFFLSKLIWFFSCRYTRLQRLATIQSVSIYLVPTYQTSWVPSEPPPVMHSSSRQTLWFKEQPFLEKRETYTGQYQQEKRRPESPFSHYSTEVHTRSGYSTAFSPVVVWEEWVGSHRFLGTRWPQFGDQLFRRSFLAIPGAQHLETLEPM